MPYQSHLSTLPFEIRSLIHLNTLPPIPTTVTILCCASLLPTQPKQQPPNQKPTTTTRCLLPFTTIASLIDPLHVAIHSPTLAPPAIYIFCSVGCVRWAMRTGTPQQRGSILRAGAVVRVALKAGEVDWVIHGRDVPMGVVEERPVKGLWWRGELGGCGVGESGDGGEERLWRLRERMFRVLGGVGKRYNGGEGRMRFWWGGKNGGAGGVELMF